MKRAWPALFVSVALLVALGAAACGGGALNDGAVLSAYSNAQYGFSVKFPAGWVEATKTGSKLADPLFVVFFADGNGAQVAGQAVDVMAVSVYKVSKPVTAADVKKKQKEFTAMAMGLVGKPVRLRVVEPPSVKTVDGQPAISVTYTYRLSGKDVAAMSTLVFKGDTAYWITGQASRATWPTMGRVLASCMATFAFE